MRYVDFGIIYKINLYKNKIRNRFFASSDKIVTEWGSVFRWNGANMVTASIEISKSTILRFSGMSILGSSIIASHIYMVEVNKQLRYV